MIVQWVNVEHALRILNLIIDIKIMHVFVVTCWKWYYEHCWFTEIPVMFKKLKKANKMQEKAKKANKMQILDF